MTTSVTVTTQTELDTALADSTVDRIEIRSDEGVWLAVRSRPEVRVVAWGSSRVVAWESSSVEAWESSQWIAHHGVEVTDGGRAVLYKAVDANLVAGHYHTRTTYPLAGELTAPDWRDDHECGGGLHLSPTPSAARAYFTGDGDARYLRCTAAVADIRVVDGNDDSSAPKVKVQTLKVEAEVDIHRRPVAQPAATVGAR